MSEFLVTAILLICPGSDTTLNGESITTDCQEYMVNCIINEAGNNEPTNKEISSCSSKLRNERRERIKTPPNHKEKF